MPAEAAPCPWAHDEMITVWGVGPEGTLRTKIKFNKIWFDPVPGKSTWIFKGFFAHDLIHPHSKKVLIQKGEEVEIKKPSLEDEIDEDW